MDEISGKRVRISIRSLIGIFGRNLVEKMVTNLDVILLHGLSHWADERDCGSDFYPQPQEHPLPNGDLTEPVLGT